MFSETLLPFPAPVGTAVTVTLHPELLGTPIPATFLGFSYEVSSLPDSTFLRSGDGALLQLYQNLGAGYIRVGGNSSDEYTWTGEPRTATLGKDSLTTTDIDGFASFVNATGWPVLFGLNLADNNASAAVNEAQYVQSKLGSSLFAFQIGNEADLFYENGLEPSTYNYADFRGQWEAYASAIRAVLPAAPLAGPDVAYNTTWIDSFAVEEHARVALIDGHFYRTGPASDPSITYETILAPDPALTTYLQALQHAAATYQLGFRVSECNSVYDGGKTGVSDVFASALWALDYMWSVAEAGGQGINFHGSTSGAYSPVARSGGVWSARPEYYAMLAFKAGSAGTLITADASFGSLNATAYACLNNQTEYLTLINKDTQNMAVTVTPGMPAHTVQVLRLSAPSFISKESITFCSTQVQSSGSYVQGTPENYGGGSPYIVNVASGSAVVVVIR
jgi:hypothetical protein